MLFRSAYESDIAFRPELWAECARVAKPNAAVVSFAGSPTYHRIASAIEAGGWRVRQMWGWVFRNGFITSAWPKEGFDRLAPAFDPICFATRGKLLLNVHREPGKAWVRKRNKDERCSWSERAGERACIGEGRWPRSIISDGEDEEFRYFALSPNSPSLRSEKVAHPNQKPLALMRWLLNKLPANSIILDPFAGSGSTLVAAIAEGMSGIGIERDPEYHDIAQRRIADARRPCVAVGKTVKPSPGQLSLFPSEDVA